MGAAGDTLVTQDQFQTPTDSLNNTMNDLKGQFGNIDLKFNAIEQRVMIIEGVVTAETSDIKEILKENIVKVKEHDEKLHFLNNKAAMMEEAVTTVESQFQHFVGEISSALTKMEKLDDYLGALNNLNTRTAELERLMMLAEGAMRSQHERMTKVENSKTENSEGRRDILDPRNLTVSVYDGTKKQFSS